MKIKIKNHNEKSVREIKCGECFTYDYALYIATDEYGQVGSRKCVQLGNGNMIYFENETVTPVDAEVVVHD